MSALERSVIEDFLYRETDLLDSLDLEAWMQLFTDDGLYWMPVAADQPPGFDHVSIFHDDRTLMAIRAAHLKDPTSASKRVPLRLSHLLGHVRIVDADEAAGRCTVGANFHCVMFYRDSQTVFAGRTEHDLVSMDGDWRIQRKTVHLLNCDDSHPSIHTYL